MIQEVDDAVLLKRLIKSDRRGNRFISSKELTMLWMTSLSRFTICAYSGAVKEVNDGISTSPGDWIAGMARASHLSNCVTRGAGVVYWAVADMVSESARVLRVWK